MDTLSIARARTGALFATEVDSGPPLMQRHAANERHGALDGEVAFYSADEGGTVQHSTGAARAVAPIPAGQSRTIRASSAAAPALVVHTPGEPFERVAPAGALTESTMRDALELVARRGVEMIAPISGSQP
ncbi:hypothetical protein DVA67_009200 [Solirubrobacter sp. CPCC 204708]|uniref:Cupin domain-containing protein n=1 Tax=Solirubrobacter deserti TaxID=2282478 RepID=A0ABT4REE3_9ACTN|nr:hypothetical protein [Solirubrobacter deserti]MBE2316151.1 hypothetical protein [Solirubrobacter deserti]MDA0136901.1 hypothetical protein [Solirubrobacter deserti]